MQKHLFILFFCLTAIFAQAQQPSEATVRELLEVSGAMARSSQVLDNMFAEFQKSANDKTPNDFFDRFKKEIDVNTMYTLFIPVYQKHYTEQDLRAAIDYYKTPFGQKMLAKSPAVMQESMEIGGKWGREVGEKVMDRMQKEGYMKRSAPSEVELEQLRMDSIAAAQAAEQDLMVDTTTIQTPASQKIEYNFIKEMEAADSKRQKSIEKAVKKREKALAKLKK